MLEAGKAVEFWEQRVGEEQYQKCKPDCDFEQQTEIGDGLNIVCKVMGYRRIIRIGFCQVDAVGDGSAGKSQEEGYFFIHWYAIGIREGKVGGVQQAPFKR